MRRIYERSCCLSSPFSVLGRSVTVCHLFLRLKQQSELKRATAAVHWSSLKKHIKHWNSSRSHGSATGCTCVSVSVGLFILWSSLGAFLSSTLSWLGCLYSSTHLVLFLLPLPSVTLLLQYIACVSLSFTPSISINSIFQEFTLTINMLTLVYPHIFWRVLKIEIFFMPADCFFSAEICSAFSILLTLRAENETMHKSFYAFILNYILRVVVTDRTKSSRPRRYRHCASCVWSTESIWLRQQKYKSPHEVKEKRKNLKKIQQQHCLGIKCQINVTPAVTFILILSTSSKMLYSTTAIEARMVIWFISYWLSDNPIFYQYEQFELLKHPLVQSVGKSHTGNTK